MEYKFEQHGTVGIFTFKGKLSPDYEDELKLILMRAIHSMDRAVLNFKQVTRIDFKCLQLIEQAYFTSIRLKNPLILTDMPHGFFSDSANKNNKEFTIHEYEDDTEKVILK